MRATRDGVTLEELIAAVKSAIRMAGISRVDHARDLRIVSARLTLNAVATVSTGGKLQFTVPFLGTFGVGSSVKSQVTHVIDIALTPVDSADTHEISGSVEDVLVDALVSIREIMRSAADGADPFELEESSVELSFAVTEDGSITLGFDVGAQHEVFHKLKVTVGPPRP